MSKTHKKSGTSVELMKEKFNPDSEREKNLDPQNNHEALNGQTEELSQPTSHCETCGQRIPEKEHPDRD